MKDTNYEDGYKEGFAIGYLEGFKNGRLFEFDSQEDFTNKINELIALGEEQGFSTKGILNTQIHSDKPSLFDIIKESEFKEGKIDASKIKVTRIYREGDKEGVRVEMWKEED